jgi:hypothetical protein
VSTDDGLAPGPSLYRLTPWPIAPRIVVRCDASLTVLSSRFRLLPSETDSPVSAVLVHRLP